MMDIDWNQAKVWLGWLAAIFVAVVAVRGTFKFDVNQWLRDRRKAREENMRLLCPHTSAVVKDGKLELTSAYVSPVGTVAYQCQICGRITQDRREPTATLEYWARNMDSLMDRHDRMEHLARKLGR